MNVWTFTGRLGADGELRTTQSGEKVLGFRVANDVGFGERKTTQWVDCSIWGRRAESLAPHLTKGKGVVVSGEVTLREYEKRDGTRGAGLSVRVAEIDFMGGGREEGGGGGGYESRGSGGGYGGGGGGGRGPGGGGGAPPRHDDLDDEIPF
ncbi:MAG TPA: single-stranded DNA-binding protein [Azospirillum sp.]|nr:single-stranded DNA-binding protein [Azospirillum sp.]